jgi:hypothetical protein
MKLRLLTASVICLLLAVALSCSNGGITDPTDPDVVIYESFEKDGRPSLAGWSPDDTTSHIKFSRDVPPGGGNWSLAIEPDWAPGFYLACKIAPALQGTNRYRLSFWARTTDSPGFARLNFNEADSSVVRRFILIADAAWSPYSVVDTIAANAGDSILVGLSGGFAEVWVDPSYTYFDLVKLEKLD